jgi:ribonuclease HI
MCDLKECDCILTKNCQCQEKITYQAVSLADIFDSKEWSLNKNKARIQSQSYKMWANIKCPFNIDTFIKLCNDVYLSGVPNYIGYRIQVPSNINVDFLKMALQNYSDKEIIQFLTFGWPINYTACSIPKCKGTNHKGAIQFEAAIDKYLAQELEWGATIGPFTSNPLVGELVISPLNSVPKKDSTDRRVILDLSFPRGRSVNDGIPKGEYQGEEIELSYPKVDDLAEQIKDIGLGCKLYKRDLKKAYRQIPIDPGDVHFLGYSWKGNIFIDRNAPMGLRTSALMCQRMTSAVAYLHRQSGYTCINYVDDLAGVALPDEAFQAFKNLGQIIMQTGLIEASEKACKPSTKMIFLGIEFDTEKMQCRIPETKLIEVKKLVASWDGKKCAKKVELQSLIGSLQFVAKCVRPGRVFIGRMLQILSTLKCQHHKFKIKSEFRKDLSWWRRFLEIYNGVSLIPDTIWSKPDKVFATDACLVGCGGVMENEYFHVKYPDFIKSLKLCINSLEMLTVTIALKLWANKLSGKRVLIYCDNEVTVHAINSGKVKNNFLLKNLREQRYLCALRNFEIKAVHLPGCENRIADALSRWDLSTTYAEKFIEMTKHKNMCNIIVNDALFKLHDFY